MSESHLGSSIYEFLTEEGVFEEAQAQVIEEVLAWQVAKANKDNKVDLLEQDGGER